MEIQILDSAGKPLDHLTQWDRNREIRVTGLADMDILPDFHFYNRDAYRALVVPGVNADGGLKAQIPNVLLQSADNLSVSVYQRKANGEGQSLLIRNIPIWKSRKPQDYTFTENVEYIRFEDLVKQSEAVLSDLQAKSADAAAAADQAKKTAQDVETALENGAFNGPEGPAGPAGADGFSPVANVTQTAGGAAIRIVDKKGVTEVTIANGKDGAPGIQGKPGKDAPQIDDSQPGPGNPFSSQHTADLIAAAKEETYIRTVDALAPVFEKTGAIVQGQLVDGYPIHVEQNLDVVQAGTGAPSPTNIRRFIPWREAKLTRCGDNLLNQLESKTTGALTVAVNPDKSLHISGALSPIMIIFRKVLKLRKGATLNGWISQNYVTGKTLRMQIAVAYGDRTDYKYTIAGNRDFKYTLTENAAVTVTVQTDETAGGEIDYNLNFGIFPTEKTHGYAYIPYQGETFTAAFPGPVYGGKLDWGAQQLKNQSVRCNFAQAKVRDQGNTWVLVGRSNPELTINTTYAVSGITFAKQLEYVQIVTFGEKLPFLYIPKTYVPWKTIAEAEAFVNSPEGANAEALAINAGTALPLSIPGSPDVLPGTTTVYADTGDVTVKSREDPAAAIKSQDERIAALEAAIMKPRG